MEKILYRLLDITLKGGFIGIDHFDEDPDEIRILNKDGKLLFKCNELNENNNAVAYDESFLINMFTVLGLSSRDEKIEGIELISEYLHELITKKTDIPIGNLKDYEIVYRLSSSRYQRDEFDRHVDV